MSHTAWTARKSLVAGPARWPGVPVKRWAMIALPVAATWPRTGPEIVAASALVTTPLFTTVFFTTDSRRGTADGPPPAVAAAAKTGTGSATSIACIAVAGPIVIAAGTARVALVALLIRGDIAVFIRRCGRLVVIAVS